MIQALIDKQDTFEIVRDQIAQILANETVNQQTLAATAGKTASLWAFKVYTERSNPWEQYLNENPDKTPIVNVWFDSTNFNESASNGFQRQKSETVYNIDVYGYGVATNTTNGHNPGDRDAALNCQRVVRLVRNILMSADYNKLGLRGIVWDRWPLSITQFQPDSGSSQMQQIVAARIALRVSFNEFAPQITGEILEGVDVEILRAETGEILAQVKYE